MQCGKTLDNRSCLPKYCLACFQRNLDERLAAEPALTLSEPATPGTLQAEADLPMRDSEPECGWPRRKRESEQCWYARVQAHLDGPDKRKKQKAYMSTWRSSMTEADRRAWKDGIQKRVSAEGPVVEPAEEPGTEELDRGQVAESRQQEPVKVKETSLVLLEKIRELLQEFTALSATHSDRLQHVEGRYRMYRQLVSWLLDGLFPSCNALANDERLAALHIERKKLGMLHQVVVAGGVLPEEAPPAFRTGAFTCVDGDVFQAFPNL